MAVIAGDSDTEQKLFRHLSMKQIGLMAGFRQLVGDTGLVLNIEAYHMTVRSGQIHDLANVIHGNMAIHMMVLHTAV